MHAKKLLALLGILALMAMVGCSGDDDTIADPGSSDDGNAGLVLGGITQGDTEFEFMSEAADDLPGPHPIRFMVRGSNIHYDAELGALLVDLTVVNASENSYPEPVHLTFLSLMPEGVQILNADNGETGPGASFLCEFANDDAQWTPGEESFPFTVQFDVDEGVSVGFAARVDVGMVPGSGTIGGVVWHDLNEDGVIDADEEGLADVTVSLHGGTDQHWLATSGSDGTYRFDGLAAGYYTVTRLPRDDLRSTTPPQIQVLLVADEEGEISDFIAANFGCLVFVIPPEGEIQVGDCLHAKGDYSLDAARLEVAHLCPCGDDDDDEDEDKDNDCWERLSGPVSAVDLENDTVSVMGSLLMITEDSRIDLDLDTLEIGDRVRAEVMAYADDDSVSLEVCRLRTFNGNWDRVRGYVDQVDLNDAGEVTHVVILGVTLDVSEAGDCDEDDD